MPLCYRWLVSIFLARVAWLVSLLRSILFVAWAGVKSIGAYVHYPTISTDMLGKVQRRESSFNNDGAIARSATLSTMKLYYYRSFAWLYGWAGGYAQRVMVNSTWTKDHVNAYVARHLHELDTLHWTTPILSHHFLYLNKSWHRLWKVPDRTEIVYPPCDTKSLEKLPLEGRKKVMVSVAQFRPEKDHALQLEAFGLFLNKFPEHRDVQFRMIGGCRNAGDESRVQALQAAIAKDPLLDSAVTIETNIPYPELKNALGEATIGIHTMRDEHFGIGVVEFLAAG